MRRIFRLLLVAIPMTCLAAIKAMADSPAASPAPLPLRFDGAAFYDAQVQIVTRGWEKGQPSEFVFVQINMALAPEKDNARATEMRRFATRDVHVTTNNAGQMAGARNVGRMREFFEKMELSVPIRADGTVDYTRFASLPEQRDEYTRCLTAALVPGFPAPPTDRRGAAVSLVTGRLFEDNLPVQPHIGYFDGWASRPDQSAGASFDYSLFATQSERPENSAIAKFVYSGDVKGGAFDLCLLTDTKNKGLLASRLRYWSKVVAKEVGVEAWKTYSIRLKSPVPLRGAGGIDGAQNTSR